MICFKNFFQSTKSFRIPCGDPKFRTFILRSLVLICHHFFRVIFCCAFLFFYRPKACCSSFYVCTKLVMREKNKAKKINLKSIVLKTSEKNRTAR